MEGHASLSLVLGLGIRANGYSAAAVGGLPAGWSSTRKRPPSTMAPTTASAWLSNPEPSRGWKSLKSTPMHRTRLLLVTERCLFRRCRLRPSSKRALRATAKSSSTEAHSRHPPSYTAAPPFASPFRACRHALCPLVCADRAAASPCRAVHDATAHAGITGAQVGQLLVRVDAVPHLAQTGPISRLLTAAAL